MGVKILGVIFLLSLVWSTSISAASDAEKTELRNIARELALLAEHVNNIQKMQRVDDLSRFDYGALLNDLTLMQQAISRQVDRPSREPRKIEPLRLDYEAIQ